MLSEVEASPRSQWLLSEKVLLTIMTGCSSGDFSTPPPQATGSLEMTVGLAWAKGGVIPLLSR